MKIFTFCSFSLLLFFAILTSQAQDIQFNKEQPDIVIRGNESPDLSSNPIIDLSQTPDFKPVLVGGLVFEVHNITDIATGYDLQSNASTQQIWMDYGNPDYLHAHFTNSLQSAGWSDRACIYFGSLDAGVTWFQLGPVPTTGRAGFPAIYGNSQGAGVLLNHNNFFGGFTRTTVSVDNSPFEYNFTNYDPGDLGDGPVWPRVIVDQQDNVIFATSGAPDAILHLNTLNSSTGLFTGWQNVDGADEVEKYDLSISNNGKIGLAFVGNAATNPGDVFYQESTDGGLTWATPVKIFDANTPAGSDSVLGHLRGISINYYNEDPCVTFELGWITTGGYYPGLPSEIRFWSQNVNGGVSIVIADSSNVPFYPNYGVADVQFPLSRPVIGRADNGYLFVAFNGTTGDYWPGSGPTDSTAYYAGFFTYSSDGGNTWDDPSKFTPDSPLRDWRFPSIAEIIPVAVGDEEIFTIHIVMQGDSIPGSTVNSAPPMPVGVTAQYYHFSTEVVIIPPSVEDDYSLRTFNLAQNYPNPFNPRTIIKYSIPYTSFVQLKVYDVLGNEIVTLVNKENPAGSHEVELDAKGIPSGVYFYKLNAGNFSQTKKMVLLR
jgi:hypothetical protein